METLVCQQVINGTVCGTDEPSIHQETVEIVSRFSRIPTDLYSAFFRENSLNRNRWRRWRPVFNIHQGRRTQLAFVSGKINGRYLIDVRFPFAGHGVDIDGLTGINQLFLQKVDAQGGIYRSINFIAGQVPPRTHWPGHLYIAVYHFGTNSLYNHGWYVVDNRVRYRFTDRSSLPCYRNRSYQILFFHSQM